jgi:hypothetical protein
MEMTTDANPTTNVWLAKIRTTSWHGSWSHQGHAQKPTPSQHRAH